MTHYSDDLYSTITNIFNDLNIGTGAADCHGILCGIYCATGKDNYSLWEQEVMEGVEASQQARAILKDLSLRTGNQLDSDDFSFALLLPPDDVPLEQRAHALGDWCQGFFLGLLLGGITDLEAFSDDVNEFTKDLTEIAQAGGYLLEDTEQDEQAYMELVEYVRAGIQLTKEDLFKMNQQKTIH